MQPYVNCKFCEGTGFIFAQKSFLGELLQYDVLCPKCQNKQACPSRNGVSPGAPHVYQNDTCIFCGCGKR